MMEWFGDKYLEDIIHKAKRLGYVTGSDLLEDSDLNSLDAGDIVKTIVSREMKGKLLAFGLIKEFDKEEKVYYLTIAGREFESFERSIMDYRNNKEKLQLEVENLRRDFFDYPQTRRIAKWSLGIAIGLLALELIKLLVSLDSK